MNKQLALAIQLNEEARLADFCWGDNTILREHLLQSLAKQGERLIYIWGSSGMGKSYLLQSYCQAVSATHSAIYLPLRILKEFGPSIIEGISDQDFICIDDIDCIVQDKAWEEALFHFFNQANDQEKIILFSATYSPNYLNFFLPDLQSRLSWGLVFQLLELSDEDKMKTMKIQALKRGFNLPTSVAHYLITRTTRNMHDLQSLINRLDEASLREQRKITIPFAKETLGL
ncbi:ATPase regulatory factor involved in DnaA inactivation (plasmid) [Legionella adelaidensis]|uniref:ATPase regulatory factor involved in DnaA inactivation n=1 Tax=Legionella adelaidensis TaxID=45056 RepID=A0A0W0R0H0_9GAMM|nr:DnaA regulatory inactivator Hda [Legionella adelaidensis]KTC64579.1 ATPase regulatory factor involved in DnaA inactivation [Legionella adelaidensis]VEH85947.1 ATPase regulatory factor involved in DnaA inactivation [Legionella adelaidensis]